MNSLNLLLKIIVFAVAISFVTLSSAESGRDGDVKKYRELRSQYRTLVREDPHAIRFSAWEGLHKDLSSFVDTFPEEHALALNATFLKARISEELCNEKVTSYCKEAEIAFTRLLDMSREHNLVDDALLGLARMKRRKGDVVGSRIYLERILKEFQGSNSEDMARLYLDDLKKQKSKRVLYDIDPSDSGSRSEVKHESLVPPAPVVLSSVETRKPLVFIDPGHGGEEEGAHGPDGILEKDIALQISLMTRDILSKEGSVRVVLSRAVDSTATLAERTALANQVEADLFVSIHGNASPYKTSRGIETYYLDNTDDKGSLKLAERENMSSGEPLSDLAFIVSDFIQGVKIADSISAAHFVQDSLVRTLRTKYDGIKNLGVKKAPFFVLVGAHMPCILAEVSFVDNPIEGRRLASTHYQMLVAEGLANGIRHFFLEKGRIMEAR